MTQILLFVDDDGDDVQLTRMGFKGNGFEHQVDVARDGVEALEYLSASHAAQRPLPAAIMTDLKMPRMGGLELIRLLKADARFRGIPVAVLTSSGYEVEMNEAMRLGASAYFRKPTDLHDYRGIVDEVRRLMTSA